LTSSSNGLLCGQTSHLTNFAILIGGGGNSGALDDPCTQDNAYMMHSFTKHMIVLACVTGSIILVAIVIAALLSFTTPGKKMMYGKEGYRVQKTRSVGSEMYSNTDNDDESGFA
jgi:hypothetical protein